MQHVLNHAPPTIKRKLFQPGAKAKFLQAERGTYWLAPQPTGSTGFKSDFTPVSVGQKLLPCKHTFQPFTWLKATSGGLCWRKEPNLCNTNLLYKTANTFVLSGVNIYPPANISLLGVFLQAVNWLKPVALVIQQVHDLEYWFLLSTYLA